jgi:hypothetical protein
MQHIRLPHGTEIRIAKSVYHEVWYVDIRKWFFLEKEDKWIPTRKGIKFPLELVNTVLTALGEELGLKTQAKEKPEPSAEDIASAPDPSTILDDEDLSPF